MDCDTHTLYETRPGSSRFALAAVVISALAAPLASTAPAALALLAGTAAAQPAQDERTPEDLLANFIHFVKIARFDVAASEATALLNSGLDEMEFVDLVDNSGEIERFQSAVAQGLQVDELQAVAAELEGLYRSGRLKRARNPEEIAKNIEMLGGTVGQSLFARSRLVAAGEYAAPQLLGALLGGGSASQRARVQQVLIESGRQAVAPLSESLAQSKSPVEQERILNVLAAIRYPAALPAIATTYRTTSSDAVRAAAARAIEAIGGSLDDEPADLYAALAEGYYAHREELTSFPGEDFQLIWEKPATQELTMRAVASEVFHETMALRMAQRSLALDPTSADTLALWIATAFRYEAAADDLEYADTVTPREAMYFAVATGPDISQRILARAIDTRDTPLALRAIEAIEQTAGVEALTGISDDRQPLVEALGFHSRRVQVDAALAIASAQPTSEFVGADRVVPILASAIRNAGERFAIVLTGKDREEFDRVRDLLVSDGYTVLPPAENGVKDLASPISEIPGVDLVVISMNGEEAIFNHDEARAEPRLSAAPMLLLASSGDVPNLSRRFNRDQTVLVRRNQINEDEFNNAVAQLVDAALGGRIDDATARAYSGAALGALRDLAVGRNTILRVSDAAMPLISAIGNATGEKAINIAEVLSYVDQPRAQVAITDAALDASGKMQLDLLDRVAASARRFGNMLEPRQINRILELAKSQDEATAIAAATVAGALSLPNQDLVPLIISDASTATGDRAGR